MRRFAPIFLLAALPAQAQLYCGQTAELEKHLKEKYNEEVGLEAQIAEDMLMQIFAAPNGTTGTLVLKRANGVSCIQGMLENIRPVRRVPAKKPEVML